MRRFLLALIAACLPLSAEAAEPVRLADQIAAATELRPVVDSWTGRQTGVMLLSHPRDIGPGFCRVDVLKPIFDMPVDWSRPFEGEARVVGFDARAYYYGVPPRAECHGPAPEPAAMFTAPMDAWVAMAWGVLLDAREQARAGSLPVVCPEGAAKCRAEVAKIDTASLRQIERCDAREDRANHACFLYVVGGLILRVTFPVAGSSGIKRVEVERQPPT